jgi:CubicO group peptidase (beta-lactamase class C family)
MLLGSVFCAPDAVAVDTAALLSELDAVRERHGVPAYAVVVTDAERTLLAATRGVADVASGRMADAETRFRIGSITKAFTSIALLLAEADGDLSLDDRLRTWTPDALFTNPWAATDPVRVAHLLEHSAGFHDWVAAEWDSATPLDLDTALALRPESRICRWPPGRYSSYSNSGAGLAASVLEAATGTTYEQFVSERIFARLGMTTATLALDEMTRRLLATGYQADGIEVIPYWHMLFRAAAGINLNPREMGVFIRLLLSDGEHDGRPLLTRPQVERMETPRTTMAARAGLQFGYGLGVYQWQRDGHSFFGHGGDADGYLAHFGYSRAAGQGYFVVINAFNHRPLRAMRAIIETALVRDLPPVDYPAPTRLRDPAALTGRFEPLTARFPGAGSTGALRIVASEGRLYTIEGGRSIPLVPVTPTLFRRPDQSLATIAIIDDGDGQTYLLGGAGDYRRVSTDGATSGP